MVQREILRGNPTCCRGDTRQPALGVGAHVDVSLAVFTVNAERAGAHDYRLKFRLDREFHEFKEAGAIGRASARVTYLSTCARLAAEARVVSPTS